MKNKNLQKELNDEMSKKNLYKKVERTPASTEPVRREQQRQDWTRTILSFLFTFSKIWPETNAFFILGVAFHSFYIHWIYVGLSIEFSVLDKQRSAFKPHNLWPQPPVLFFSSLMLKLFTKSISRLTDHECQSQNLSQVSHRQGQRQCMEWTETTNEHFVKFLP